MAYTTALFSHVLLATLGLFPSHTEEDGRETAGKKARSWDKETGEGR